MTTLSISKTAGRVCLASFALMSLLVWLFPSGAASGMISFLAIPLALSLILCAAIGAVLRKFLTGIVMVISAALVGGPVVLMNTGPPAAGNAIPTHTLVWLNAKHSHLAVDQIFDIDRTITADVIAIAEAPVNWKRRYATQLEAFSCVEWRRSDDAARILILSRATCMPGQEELNDTGDGNFTTVDRTDGLRIVAIHAPRPFDLSRILRFELPWRTAKLNERNESIRSAAIRARLAPKTLLVGDFNAVAWAPPLTDLADIGLQAIPCGPVWQSTWIDKSTGLGVPIDHAYVPQGTVATCNIGGDVGSDHRPLIVRIYEPNEPKPEITDLKTSP